MQSSNHFSNSWDTFFQNSVDCEIGDWLATLSLDELQHLKYQIEVLVSPLPIGISSQEGFDLNYLAFKVESQRRKESVVTLVWGKRARVLIEIAQQIVDEVENRRVRNGSH